MKAVAAAAAAAGGGEGGRGGALAVVGTKRKKGAGGSRGGGVLWSPRGDGPSHGPVQSFGTRNTGVVRWDQVVCAFSRCLVICSFSRATCMAQVVLRWFGKALCQQIVVDNPVSFSHVLHVRATPLRFPRFPYL